MVATNSIINHDVFKRIIQYKPAVIGVAARNHLKMEMLNTVISSIGEKWNRMKQETRSALEYLCFLSVERGFVYAGSQSVGERYSIDSSTVRRYLCQLEKQGVIIRKWRSSVKRNSRGQAIIFFTAHPYFSKYWESKFFYTTDTQENAQDEMVETLTESKGNDENEVSTIPKPNILKDLNKRSEESSTSKFTSNRVPKEFTKLASYFFNDFRTIEKLWSKVTIAAWKRCFENDHKLTLGVGVDALKQTVRALKVKKIRDLPAYFYGILSKKFEDEYFAEVDKLGASISH